MRSSRKFTSLNGPNKLVFVRMYGSTITGLVGPPYPYCLLVAFCTFGAFLYFFVLLVCEKSFRKKNNKEFKTSLITPHLQSEVIRDSFKQKF